MPDPLTDAAIDAPRTDAGDVPEVDAGMTPVDPPPCFVPDDPRCPAGCAGAQWQGTDYVFCEGPASWSSAKSICRDVGMDLASANSLEENRFFTDQTNERFFSLNLWLGGSDIENEGTWVWPDGTVFWQGNSTQAFENWSAAQPLNILGSEDATLLTIVDIVVVDRGEWFSTIASQRHPFACERPPGG